MKVIVRVGILTLAGACGGAIGYFASKRAGLKSEYEKLNIDVDTAKEQVLKAMGDNLNFISYKSNCIKNALEQYENGAMDKKTYDLSIEKFNSADFCVDYVRNSGDVELQNMLIDVEIADTKADIAKTELRNNDLKIAGGALGVCGTTLLGVAAEKIDRRKKRNRALNEMAKGTEFDDMFDLYK